MLVETSIATDLRRVLHQIRETGRLSAGSVCITMHDPWFNAHY